MVAELVKALPWAVVREVCEPLKKRYGKEEYENLETRKQSGIFFVKRMQNLMGPTKSVRGICSHTVLSKLYVGSLMVAIKRRREAQKQRAPQENDITICGFEERHRIEHVTEVIRSIEHVGVEGAMIPRHICSKVMWKKLVIM